MICSKDADDDGLMNFLLDHCGAGALEDPYGQSVEQAVTPEVALLPLYFILVVIQLLIHVYKKFFLIPTGFNR